METVNNSFNERVEEINKFLRALKTFENPSVVLLNQATGRKKKPIFPGGTFQVMKATVFLLIYNFVESSIRLAFGELYKSIETCGLPLKNLKKEFRKIWVNQRYSSIDLDSASSKIFRELSETLIEELVAESIIILSEDRLPVSGNLDSASIHKICSKHCISSRVHKRALGGMELGTVKKHRNALAHGNSSFSECGREYTVEDLIRINAQAVIFIRGVIKNIEKFIQKSGFVGT